MGRARKGKLSREAKADQTASPTSHKYAWSTSTWAVLALSVLTLVVAILVQRQLVATSTEPSGPPASHPGERDAPRDVPGVAAPTSVIESLAEMLVPRDPREGVRLEEATQLVRSLPNGSGHLLDLPIDKAGVPLFHYAYNLIVRVQQPRPVLDLVEALISAGADVNVQHPHGEPSVLFKSIVSRQLKVTRELLDAGAVIGSKDDQLLLRLLTVPCDTVPFSKLLLHADTALRAPELAARFAGEEGVRRFVQSANRGAGSKPLVSSDDLFAASSEYRAMLAQLGALSGRGITMAQIVASLSEAVSPVVESLLRYDPRTGGAKALTRFLVDSDHAQRNMLHVAAAAGATPVLQAVERCLQSAVAAAKNSSELATLQAVAQQALDATDARGLTPLDYAVQRWGNMSATAALPYPEGAVDGLRSVAQAAGAVLREGGTAAAGATGTAATFGGTSDAQRSAHAEHAGRETGGWDSTAWQPPVEARDGWQEGRCDITEVWDGADMTSERFFHEFVREGRPAVLRGAGLGLPSRASFTKEAFADKYGARQAPIGTIPYASSFGMSSGSMTMAELANMGHSHEARGAQSYAFTVAMRDWHGDLQRDAPPPPWLQELLDAFGGSQETQFFLGPAGSGAPVHYHGHAVNVLAYGAKRWKLMAPSHAFYSKMPAEEFYLSRIAEGNATESTGLGSPHELECMQYAGDVMFVPTLWGHGTLNTLQSIGTAYEFSIESFCME